MSEISLVQILCPIGIWLILVGFFTTVCFSLREGVMKLKTLHQIPCNNCIFSTGDYRLKCTIHPCIAFSEEAIHCLDYE